MQELRQPAFDPDIIRRHLNADVIEAGMRAALEMQARGEKRNAWSGPIPAEEIGTDKSMGQAVPYGPDNAGTEAAFLAILKDLRDLGLLLPVPYVEGRRIREADAWNRFVETGEILERTFGYLEKCPVLDRLSYGMLSGSMDAIRDMRVAAGLDPYAGYAAAERVGAKALMPMGERHVRPIAEAAAAEALLTGSGQKPYYSTRDIACPKTDEKLSWDNERILAPVLGKMVWGDREKGTRTRFEPIEPWVEPRAIRHVEIAAPSGRVLMADWFRVPGFTEGIMDPEEFTRPGISSDLGIDLRTRDHYERLGLMRIHTTNCVPKVIREEGVFRVGHIDEDHEDLWIENEDGGIDENKAAMPDVVGRVCCDLWDVTFADREILIDIIVAGGRAIEANGGKGKRGQVTVGYVTDREAAGALLDEYAATHDVAVLEVDPGARLHVYMATGHNMHRFSREFTSPDLKEHGWFEDMFVISDREMRVDPQDLEDGAWACPSDIFDRDHENASPQPGF